MEDNDAVPALADLSRRTLQLMAIPEERRKDRRVRLTAPLPARLGNTEVVIADLGARGARLHHEKPVTVATEFRLTFQWPDGPFRATVRVLASRLMIAAPSPKFESRLQFLEVPPESKRLLERVVKTLTDSQLRQWVSNFMGEVVSPRPAESQSEPRALLRFRLMNGRWTARPAKPDEAAPTDGFIVPASIEPGEINVLCAAYSRLDRDSQQLLRLFATAALAA